MVLSDAINLNRAAIFFFEKRGFQANLSAQTTLVHFLFDYTVLGFYIQHAS